MFDIDYIIPCYGSSEIIRPGLRSLANQWHSECLHVILVDDCSPNTDCGYQDLVDEFRPYLDIRCIRTPENMGQGLARQWGIDHSCHEYFMLQDEDDMLANPLAVSIFIGAVEDNIYQKEEIPGEEGNVYILDGEGKPAIDGTKKPVAVVSGPLFEFDDHHTRVIEAGNRIWVNAKLYNRKFLEKHNIRFNEAQSRHAEDYYFMNCFFYCLDHDSDYTGILLDDHQLTYLWYPNEGSQSRKDPHYGFMLSGYTMNGSVNILEFMKDTERHQIEWNEEIEAQYRHTVLNMLVYSYFTFLSFIRRVASTDYVPALVLDWYMLRDSCNTLRERCMEYYDTYTYTEKMEEYYTVRHFSDVQFTEPWVDLDTYIADGCEELRWSFGKLLQCKEKYRFNEWGLLV